MTLSASRITLHIQEPFNYGWEAQRLVDAGVRGVKILNSVRMAQDIHNGLGDDCVIVIRWMKGEEDGLQGDVNGWLKRDPNAAAQRWFDYMHPVLVQAPFAYWEAVNEWGEWSLAAQFAQFESHRQELLNQAGLRACIGNFSVGNPPDLSTWLAFLPMLDTANQYHNLLGLHEYNSPHLNSGDPIWTVLRHRSIWNMYNLQQRCPDLRLFLTEFGWDDIGNGLSGWRKSVNAQQAASEIFGFADVEFKKDPYFVAAAFFAVTTQGTWHDFNPVDTNPELNLIDPILAGIKAQIGLEPTPTPVPVPTPTPAPVPQPWNAPSGRATVTIKELNIRSGPGKNYPEIGELYGGWIVSVEGQPVNGYVKMAGQDAYLSTDFLKGQ